jgi:hypothetical protein
MKSLFRFIFPALAIVMLVFVQDDCVAQTDSEVATLKSSLERRTYTFNAQSASPQGGGFVRLNPGYTLQLKGDTLICDLPYYGRLYNPQYGGDAGLKFTSNKYSYNLKLKKKGGYNVTIETSDLITNRKMFLTIFDNGSASLSVSASDRQSISYQGIVEVKK